MKKLLCNSLVASVVAVAGATAFTSQANAQSVDLDFNGTVGNTCEITKLKDGKLGLTDKVANQEYITSRPDESNQGEFGEIEVNCIGSGNISVSVPTPISAAAKNFAATGSTNRTGTEIFSSDSPVADNVVAVAGESVFTGTGTLALNNTPKRLYVHVFTGADGGRTVPAGNYEYKTTVTITPQ